jgi:ferrous iron transport protein B
MTARPQPVVDESQSRFVALIGPPNSGKTTLYNQLTGSSSRAVNYPGSTVDFTMGHTRKELGPGFPVFDTPGTYSLFPKSPEEEVTRNVIFSHPTLGAAHTLVVVVDATQLARHLVLVRQLIEARFRIVVAVTMTDLLQKQGLELDAGELADQLHCSVVTVNGLTGEGIDRLAEVVRQRKENLSPPPMMLPAWTGDQHEAKATEAAAFAKQALRRASHAPANVISPSTYSRVFDSILLHPVWGLLIFVGIMAALFCSIFWLAVPLMDWVDAAFSWSAHSVRSLAPNSLWADFLANGLITSLGAVIVFVPQVAILFLGITFLEDTGYLARAASLVDKPLSKLGLNGRSFVPLLSAHACAIPAMLAARTIPGRKERWLTLFVIPLMSCSARLPVYSLLLAFLFRGEPAWKPGLAMTAVYFSALILGALIATIVNRVVKMGETSFFMLELPWYRRPRVRTVLNIVRMKTGAYLWQAGPVILAFAVLMWFGTTFPDHNAPTESERLAHSYAAKAGRVLEPVMEPMGADWRIGVGLISAFAARETFVAATAVVLNVTEDPNSDSIQNSLLQRMHEATTPEGRPLFTPSTVVGLILFFMVALQCMATVGVARREFGNWRAPIFQLVSFNLLAYILAVSAVQLLRSIGMY